MNLCPSSFKLNTYSGTEKINNILCNNQKRDKVFSGFSSLEGKSRKVIETVELHEIRSKMEPTILSVLTSSSGRWTTNDRSCLSPYTREWPPSDDDYLPT